MVKGKWFPLTSLYLDAGDRLENKGEWFPHTPDYIKTGGGKGKWNLEPKRTVIFHNTLVIKEI